ncbi:hypothetical protein BDF14DRAFT_1721427 [Spinellus fusiger]|nr:hypothetical protein BDF14DRAFT_1721427 [Spinellus fusiger]
MILLFIFTWKKELLVNLISTSPSKREVRHFLKRFVPEHPATLSSESRQGSVPGVKSPKDFVNALLTPSTHQISLTKVEGPFDRHGWEATGSTLLKLQKLGLLSIVVTDNPAWRNDPLSAELIQCMIRETMTLVQAIETAGGRARPIYGGLLEQGTNALHINFEFIQSALDHQQIPVVVPMVVHKGLQRPIDANEVMVAITQTLTNIPLITNTLPARVVVINQEGGIPNHERPGTAHSLVNVQEEYHSIVDAYKENTVWQASHPNSIHNLTMLRDCLVCLPSTSSALIVPTCSLPKALITNLITDKPLYSSSLPINDLRSGSIELQSVNQSHTTVLRHGTKIHSYTYEQLDLPRLTKLLEASFQKTLDQESFYHRLSCDLDCAIIAGEYEGAVLMTRERAQSKSPVRYYLDKFAIAPTSQGIGLTDILWRRMCDAYPEFLWRSRQDNGVNKWYFERSNGFLRLQTTQWVLFWYGAKGQRHTKEYSAIASSIPASFLPRL